jgi:putative DNA primase/helicase
MMRADEIALSIGSAWPAILEQLGIEGKYLRNKHGPCPVCGGKDRYRFDNKHARGGFYCNGCGAGDGFTLLQRVHGWDFKTTRARVIEAAGLGRERSPVSPTAIPHSRADVPAIAQPSGRVLRLKREACALVDCPDVIEYLRGRALWPIAARTSLRAHAGVDYFEEGRKVGRYPAMLAAVRDIDGDLVTIHTTYLQAGRKLKAFEPRKLLSPMNGRDGCAVRLQGITGDVLGVAEGIESALSAAALHSLTVWAALNTAMLAKFTPPAEVKRLVIFADADEAGLGAAERLTERLQGRLTIERRTPAKGDWNDVLQARDSA